MHDLLFGFVRSLSPKGWTIAEVRRNEELLVCMDVRARSMYVLIELFLIVDHVSKLRTAMRAGRQGGGL